MPLKFFEIDLWGSCYLQRRLRIRYCVHCNYAHNSLLACNMLLRKPINPLMDPGKMGNKTFDFWRDHSSNYLEMAFSYQKREKIANPDGYAKRRGECGDTIEMFLSIRHGKIQSVSFDTDGCMNTNACCNTVARLVEGKRVETAWEITAEDVIGYLGTLQPQNYHCAELAVGTFYSALNNYQDYRRDPWKKPYKKDLTLG